MQEEAKRRYWERYHQAKEKGVPFFPDIVFKDAVVALLIFLILIALAYFRGAPLEAPANPNDTSYTPRPEWYFLWIYQMLKYFPGRLEVLGVVVLPAIGLVLLFALPFIDRSWKRHFLNRPIATAITALVVLGMAGLTVQSSVEAPPPTAEASGGGGPAALYIEDCASCHGPSIDVSPQTDLHQVIAQGKLHEGMPAWGGDLSTDQIDALVGFILSPSGFNVYQQNCATCHEQMVQAAGQPLELEAMLEQGPNYPPHSEVNVPDWTQALSSQERAALLNFLAAPDGERLFEINCASCHGNTLQFDGTEQELRQIISQGGMHLEMPPWRLKLSESDLDTLARYVVDPSGVPAGQELFNQNCSDCHGDRVPSASSVEEARTIIATGGAHETMPVWGQALTSAQLDALVSYTLELSQGGAAERGRELFSQYCAGCHGNFGEGGPNPARPGYVIPPISTREYLSRRDDTTLKNIISQGQPTFGMSPFGTEYGGPLDDEQIDAIVAFMRQWQQNPPVEAPPEIAGGAGALTGEEIYKNICAQCHGPNGEGGIGPALRDPQLQARYTDDELFDVISQGHEATPMIGFGGILTSSQIQDVIGYIRQWQGAEPQPTQAPSEPTEAPTQPAEVPTQPAEAPTQPAETPTAEAGGAVPSFANDVMPILEEHCFACHGNGGLTVAGWDARTHESVINSGDNGPAVVPGDVEGSLLARKVSGTQRQGGVMPPLGKMSDDLVQVILDWIAAGAPDN